LAPTVPCGLVSVIELLRQTAPDAFGYVAGDRADTLRREGTYERDDEENREGSHEIWYARIHPS
jgi:hypothetical protein